MPADWHKYAMKEILQSTRKMTEWGSRFFNSVKGRIEYGMGLTEKQEETLLKIHKRMTEIGRISR